MTRVRSSLFSYKMLLGLGVALLLVCLALFTLLRTKISDDIRKMEINNLQGVAANIDDIIMAQDSYLAPDTAYLVKLQNLFYYSFLSVKQFDSEARFDNAVFSANNIRKNISKGIQYNPDIQSAYIMLDDPTAPYVLVNGETEAILDMLDQSWITVCHGLTQSCEVEWRTVETSYLNRTAVITVYQKISSTDWLTGNQVGGYIVINYYQTHLLNEMNTMLNQGESVIIFNARTRSTLQVGKLQLDDASIQTLTARTQPDGGKEQNYGSIRQGKHEILYRIDYQANSGLYYLVVKETPEMSTVLFQLYMIFTGILVLFFLFIIIFFTISYNQYHRYVSGVAKVIHATEQTNSATEYQDIAKLTSNLEKGDADLITIAHKIMSDSLDLCEIKQALNSEQTLRSEVELLYGHTQINSHFLLNTMDSIYWECMHNRGYASKEAQMIEKLCLILKYALDPSGPFSALGEEIAYAKIYLDVQRMRKDLDLTVSWDIPPELMTARMGKLMTQPILENSIQHGAGATPDHALLISVSAWTDGDALYIRFTDNGGGMPEAEMARMNLIFSEHKPVTTRHIGLMNVNRRIQLQYGDDCGLVLETAASGGLSVRMKLKYLHKD